jgi:hypothetical protein
MAKQLVQAVGLCDVRKFGFLKLSLILILAARSAEIFEKKAKGRQNAVLTLRKLAFFFIHALQD